MKQSPILDRISEAIAKTGLQIEALKIRPKKPFLWASGTYNPIYNDNRMFLFYPQARNLIVDGLVETIIDFHESRTYDHFIIAGTSTSGIPWASLLSQKLNTPMIYVRDEPKKHGLKNQIEGIDFEKDLEGRSVILIEDLISTGGSSVKAVDAIRKANGVCNLCISIFNYGLPDPPKMFAGKIPYDKSGSTLTEPCSIRSLLYYPKLIQVGVDRGFISKDHFLMLQDWMKNQPFWGDKYGFTSKNQ